MTLKQLLDGKMNSYFGFLRNNLKGVFAGLVYTLVAWLLFALGMSIADSCDTKDESCRTFVLIRPLFFIIVAPNLMMWMPLEYFLVQMPLVSIFGEQANSHLATVNTFVVPAVFVPLTVLIWATIGAAIQEFSKRCRK